MPLQNFNDFLLNAAINQNIMPMDTVYHGTTYQGPIYQYNPAMANTGEGLNLTGLSHYSSTYYPEAEYYANLKGVGNGRVLSEYVPTANSYYRFGVPFEQQGARVQQALLNTGYARQTPQGVVNSLDRMLSPAEYNPLLNALDKEGVAGIRMPIYDTAGDYVGETVQTIRPENIGIRQAYEVGPRTYAPMNKVQETYNKFMQGLNKARNAAQIAIENPYVRPFARALRGFGAALGIAGTPMAIYEGLNAGQTATEQEERDLTNQYNIRRGVPLLYGGVEMNVQSNGNNAGAQQQ